MFRHLVDWIKGKHLEERDYLQHQLDLLHVEAVREDARKRSFTRWELATEDTWRSHERTADH